MKIRAAQEVTSSPVTMPGAHDCQVRWLIDDKQGAPNFAMRQFEVAPGGYTPRHSHPYEHEIFVLEGEGAVTDGQRERALRAGDCVLIMPGEVHQFRNTGGQSFKFLCLVPNTSAQLPVTLAAECSRPEDQQ